MGDYFWVAAPAEPLQPGQHAEKRDEDSFSWTHYEEQKSDGQVEKCNGHQKELDYFDGTLVRYGHAKRPILYVYFGKTAQWRSKKTALVPWLVWTAAWKMICNLFSAFLILLRWNVCISVISNELFLRNSFFTFHIHIYLFIMWMSVLSFQLLSSELSFNKGVGANSFQNLLKTSQDPKSDKNKKKKNRCIETFLILSSFSKWTKIYRFLSVDLMQCLELVTPSKKKH